MKKREVKALAAAGDVAGLSAGLADRRNTTVEAAAEALRTIGTPEAADALADAAVTRQESATGRMVGWVPEATELLALGDRRALAPLLASMGDDWGPDGVELSRRAGDREADPADVARDLAEMMFENEHRDTPAWTKACVVLAAFGDRHDPWVTAMLARVAQGNLEVAREAKGGIWFGSVSGGGEEIAFEAIESWGAERVDDLALIGVGQLEDLARFGFHNEWDWAKGKRVKAVTFLAIEALGSCGDVEARDALVELRNVELQRRPDEEARAAINDALDKIESTSDPSAPRPPAEAGPIERIDPSSVAAGDADEKSRLVLGETAYRPGDTVTFVLAVDGWPDAKLDTIEVECALEATTLTTRQKRPAGTPVGILLETAVPEGSWIVSAPELKPTVVARGTFTPEEVSADGRLAGSFAVPADAPPTTGTVARWVLRAHLRRSRGLNHKEKAELTVLGPDHDALLEVHSAADEAESDWLLRVVQVKGWTDFSGDLALAELDRDVSVELTSAVVRPGETVTGHVVVRPTRATWQVLPSRQKQRMAKQHDVELRSVVVSLECWRGLSEVQHAWGRMFTVDETLSGPVTLAEDEAHEFPFTIDIPPSTDLLTNDQVKHPVEAPTPTTYYGTRQGRPELGDIRWRIVGGATIKKYVHPGEDPLWAARELLVFSPTTSQR